MGKGCYKCMRFSVLTFNFLFVILGVGILACAIFATVDKGIKEIIEATNIKDYINYSLYGAMAIGGVTMLIGLFGCCGAYHESQCLLTTYFTFLFLIFGAKVAAGAFAIIYKETIRARVDNRLQFELSTKRNATPPYHSTGYGTVKPDKFVMDRIQYSYMCCGVNGPDDYGDTYRPISCCNYKSDGKRPMIGAQEFNENCALSAQRDGSTKKDLAFKKGCKKVYTGYIMMSYSIIIYGILGIAAIELFGLIYAIATCCSIRRRETAYTTVEHDDPYR